jgi:hypothetical protein
MFCILQRFRPVVRCGPVCRLPKEYVGVNGGLEVEEIGHGLYGPYFTGHKLAYEYQLLEPAQPQVTRKKPETLTGCFACLFRELSAFFSFNKWGF